LELWEEWEHPSNLSDRFKLSEDEEPAAKTCPEVEEPEDEGYHTIRRQGRSQNVVKK